MRILTLAPALFASLFLAGAAHAADPGPYVGLSVGSVSTTSNTSSFVPNGPKPSGMLFEVTAGDQFTFGHTELGVNINAGVTNTHSKHSNVTCTVANCGYDELQTLQGNHHLQGGVGATIADNITDHFQVGVEGGVEVTDFTQSVNYTSSTAGYVPFMYQQTSFEAGLYGGVFAKYKLTRHTSLLLDLRQTNFTSVRYKSTYGDSIDKEMTRTISVGFTHRF
jgi:hypothetical protein